jgi:hypothetical protein
MLGLFQSWWNGVKSSFSAETHETQAETAVDSLPSQLSKLIQLAVLSPKQDLS